MPAKILTVDDSRTVRFILRNALKRFDCEIIEAGDGDVGRHLETRRPERGECSYRHGVVQGKNRGWSGIGPDQFACGAESGRFAEISGSANHRALVQTRLNQAIDHMTFQFLGGRADGRVTGEF